MDALGNPLRITSKAARKQNPEWRKYIQKKRAEPGYRTGPETLMGDDELIARLKAENKRLRARVAELEEELRGSVAKAPKRR